MVGFRFICFSVTTIATLVALSSTQCFAWQSGSRGSISSGGGAITSSPSFTAPQSFPTPVNSQGFGQPDIGNFQAMPFSQPDTNGLAPQQFQSNQQLAMPQTGSSATSGSGSLGVPQAALIDPVFEINDPLSPYTVDHSAWSCFLSRYLITDSQGLNRLRYGSVTRQDRNSLKCYLQRLQMVDTRTLNRNEQLAFWFNLYNARTVEFVLDNYPIRSIRQIKQNFTDFVGPFDDEGAVTVLGKPLSLTDIESGIVRPVAKDPRIHFALNCASFGCPNLSPTAWTGQNLDQRLNAAAYQYINSDRAVKRSIRGLRVTKIFKWYKADFGETDQAVLNFIRQYADCNTLNKLAGREKIAGYFYDWSLNDARITRRRLLEPLIR